MAQLLHSDPRFLHGIDPKGNIQEFVTFPPLWVATPKPLGVPEFPSPDPRLDFCRLNDTCDFWFNRCTLIIEILNFLTRPFFLVRKVIFHLFEHFIEMTDVASFSTVKCTQLFNQTPTWSSPDWFANDLHLQEQLFDVCNKVCWSAYHSN